MQPVYKRIPIYLHNQVLACLRQHLAQANKILQSEYSEPKITYRSKGSVAGSAFLVRWEIQINTTMLCENDKTFIEEVIPHELAHLIVFKKFGKVKPHGKEWKYIMSEVFGRTPKTTHNFKTQKNNNYLYYCLCQEHYLSKVRHNKIQHNKTKYLCRKCGTILKLKKFI